MPIPLYVFNNVCRTVLDGGSVEVDDRHLDTGQLKLLQLQQERPVDEWSVPSLVALPKLKGDGGHGSKLWGMRCGGAEASSLCLLSSDP